MSNKRESNFKSNALCTMLCALGLAMSSCSMINEDMDPCAPAPHVLTIVDFSYDYNMYEKDLFYDHAGSVYLYIFDKDGYYLDRREKHKEFFSKGEDFSMVFSDDELKQGETYDLVAVAQGNTIGYDGSDEYNWFKVVNPMEVGKSRIEDYILKLDRDSNNDGYSEVGIINYKDQYGNNQQMIDTLWTTKPDQVQTINIPTYRVEPSPIQRPDSIQRVTIPMMRITNAITVNLLSSSIDQNTNPDDYHVLIHFPKGNGTIDFTGNTLPAQELYYQSLIKKIKPYVPKNVRSRADDFNTRVDEGTYSMQSLFGVSRLQTNDESSLQLRDGTKEGNPIIYELPNFSDLLAEMLNSGFYGDQEFLDREYNFQVDIVLNGFKDPDIYISFTVEDWCVRVNNIKL